MARATPVGVNVNEDGTYERQLALRKYPSAFNCVDWSPGGKVIAAGVYNSGSGGDYSSLVTVPAQGGTERTLTDHRWQALHDLAWSSDGKGMLAVVLGPNTILNEIEYIPLGTGEPRRIYSDVNDYTGLSVTSDSKAFVAAQASIPTNVWLASYNNTSSAQPVTSDGHSADPAWTPDGKIAFDRPGPSGNSEIWLMDSDGGHPQQLTLNTGRMNFSPRVCADGRYILFRARNIELWRMDIDGGNQRKITNRPVHDNDYAAADCTADGKWVFYSGAGPDWGVWKIATDGGEPIRLNTTENAAFARVSPDGKMLAYSYRDPKITPMSGVAIMQLGGSEPEQYLDIPTGVVRWTPDSRSLLYIKTENVHRIFGAELLLAE